MEQLFKILPDCGHQSVFQPGEHGIRWLGLEILRLKAGEGWEDRLDNVEVALVILGGRCDISVKGREEVSWKNIGDREDIFSGLPTAVYAPRGSELKVAASKTLELAIIKAPCDVDLLPALIAPDDVKVVAAGAANWSRDVRLIIPPGSPVSQRLIVGETLNPPGNWSGIPPHKHDETNDNENALEEFYLFKTKPADGYAVQLAYDSQEGQGHLVGNNDVMMLRSGYHPTVVPPGVTVCYLWVLSGDAKTYGVSTDPRFNWVSSAEAKLKEARQS